MKIHPFDARAPSPRKRLGRAKLFFNAGRESCAAINRGGVSGGPARLEKAPSPADEPGGIAGARREPPRGLQFRGAANSRVRDIPRENRFRGASSGRLEILPRGRARFGGCDECGVRSRSSAGEICCLRFLPRSLIVSTLNFV